MMSKNAISELRRLSGMVDDYDSWRLPQKPNLSETKDLALVVSQNRIRRMARTLSEDRMGSALLASFDWDHFAEVLHEASQWAPSANDMARHQMMQGLYHRGRGVLDKHAHPNSDPHAAHAEHSQMAKDFADAAQKLRSDPGAHPQLAQWADRAAQHHAQHAAYHAARMGNVAHSAHQLPAHPAPAGQEPAAAPKSFSGENVKKAEKANKKKIAPGWATKARVNAKIRAGTWPASSDKASTPSASVPAAPKPAKAAQEPEHKKDLPGYEGVPHKVQAHVVRAMDSSEVAHDLHKAGAAPAYKAAATRAAMGDHLKAAMGLFKAGHHDQALSHVAAFAHHMKQHAAHVDDAQAQAAQAARYAAGAGPRARVGRAHV